MFTRYSYFCILVLLLSSSIIRQCHSRCPNNCYGRGKCNNQNVCICDANYVVDGAPDCSQSILYF